MVIITYSTGATGYIGGDALYELYNKHPDYEYAVLVRSEQKGSQVKDAFPNVRIVIGDLDNSKVLEDEAAKADVVIRTLSLFFNLKSAWGFSSLDGYNADVG